MRHEIIKKKNTYFSSVVCLHRIADRVLEGPHVHERGVVPHRKVAGNHSEDQDLRQGNLH